MSPRTCGVCGFPRATVYMRPYIKDADFWACVECLERAAAADDPPPWPDALARRRALGPLPSEVHEAERAALRAEEQRSRARRLAERRAAARARRKHLRKYTLRPASRLRGPVDAPPTAAEVRELVDDFPDVTWCDDCGAELGAADGSCHCLRPWLFPRPPGASS